MKNYFEPAQLTPLKAFEKLHTLKMNPSETVQEYYETILSHTKFINVSDDQILALFLSGLPKYIKTFVVHEKPETIAQALHLAKQQELSGPDQDDTETALLLKTILEKMDSSKLTKASPKINALEERPASQPVAAGATCFNCGGSGHIMRNCSSPQQSVRPKPKNVTFAPQERPMLECTYCFLKGHVMQDCRRFQRDCQRNYNLTPKRAPTDFHPKESAQTSGYSAPPSRQSPPVCQLCDKKGHIVSECFTYLNLKSRADSSSRPQTYRTDPRNRGFFSQNHLTFCG